MIEALIALLIGLLVIGLLWWAISTVLAVIPLPEPIKTIAYVLLVVIVCLFVIYLLLGFLPAGLPRLRTW